ncbi:MAG: hypothetical protein D6705_03935, partial [Deltaproteobacteria bacterium]
LAVRLVDLGTLVTLVVLDGALLTFAFLLFRYLYRTGTGYVPPDVEPIEREVPTQERVDEGAETAPEPDVASASGHALRPA